MNEKRIELWNIEIFKNIEFSCLCNQFFVFDSILLFDEDFFTNFIQVVNGVSILPDNNGIKLEYDTLTPYSLSCFFNWDEYKLFSRFHLVFRWEKKIIFMN